MKKVAIISIMNLKHMSLVSIYTELFKKYGVDYDYIYIDKYNDEDEIDTGAKKMYKYNINIGQNDSKLYKLKQYYTFRRFVRKVLKQEKYDSIIIWRSETGILLFDLLLLNNKYRIFYNIRDYCYEKNILIKSIQKLIINKSVFTTISSKGFYNFLPDSNKYLFVNSLNPSALSMTRGEINKNFEKKTIKIGFIGNVRFYESNIQIVEAFKNDNRFTIQYYGPNSQKIEEYCIKKEIRNVEFFGSFPVSETIQKFNKIDVVNNLYGTNDISLDTAISIKYYYAVLLCLPIMVYKGTYMEEVTRDYSGAFVFEGDYNSLKEDFYKWYTRLNMDVIKNESEYILEKICKENMKFNTLLTDNILRREKGNDN